MDMLSNLTARLMCDPVAQSFADQLPANVNHAAIAEKYRILSAHDDARSISMCLAIEFHLRNLAVIAFHDYGVIDALNTMENAQAIAKKRQAATKRRENAARRRAAKLEKEQVKL